MAVNKLREVVLPEVTWDESDPRSMYTVSLSKIKHHPDLVGYRFKPNPYNIEWVHGYNHKVKMINLNNGTSTNIFYAASNFAIIYNWTTHTMKILQGHRHMVTSVASDKYGRWLATADSGPENVIIIWDGRDFFPHRTMYSPHGTNKIAKIALSSDAKFLLSLSYAENSLTLYWWIWSFGNELPEAYTEVATGNNSVIAMGFNPKNSTQFLLLTKNDIWLGVSERIVVVERGVEKVTDDYQLRVRCPEKFVTSDIGRLTCFAFIDKTSQILVGCSRGAIIVYGYTREYNLDVDDSNFELLKFIKVLKVEKFRINVITYIDDLIVTGNSNGEIHFYDDHVRLMYWVHGFKVDSIRHLSFNMAPRSYAILDPKCGKMCPCWEKVVLEVDPKTGNKTQKLLKKKLPTDACTVPKPFLVRDFILVTHNQGINFVDFVTEKLYKILDLRIAPAISLSVHPEKPLACIGYQDGYLEMVNIEEHKTFVRLNLRDHYKVVTPPKEDSVKGDYEIHIPHISATALKYSPSGVFLACGLSNGQLIFLDPVTMEIKTKKPHKDTSFAIKDIVCSEDSLTLAFSDTGKTVCVYKYDCQAKMWSFIGKHRAHYKDINCLLFLPPKTTNGDFTLISLGADRIMAEYDIGKSSNEYLEVFSIDRMEQSAIPLTAIRWPTPSHVDPETCKTDLPLLLVANDEYKYKIVNYDTTMTLSTILGPRYEQPVSRMEIVSRDCGDETVKQYLLFATKSVIGLQLLPLDGNPWKYVARLGHPNGITVTCFYEPLNTLLNIGSKDSCMCLWTVNYNTVEITEAEGGVDLDPYYCLIENGRPGWLFQEIRDLFYYIQILCQGTFSPAQRSVKDYIPIDSLPDLMRALGYFPTEFEVENLLTEARYKVYLTKPVTEIDFEEFVKLYINHRPAFGDNMRKIRNAFRTFATFRRDDYNLERDVFLEALAEYGEQFPKELSWYLLSILAGLSFEDRAQMTENDFGFLPMNLKFSDLLSTIMGVSAEVDRESADQLSVTSIYSQKSGSSAGLDSDVDTLM